MLGRQEEIKPIGQPWQYDRFPSTSLLLPFFNDNELSYSRLECHCGLLSSTFTMKNSHYQNEKMIVKLDTLKKIRDRSVWVLNVWVSNVWVSNV